MQKEELKPLLNMYSQRYGAYTMQPETMKMWWGKLNTFEAEHVRESFEQLLGSRDKSFGWKAVIQVIEAIHPEISKIQQEVVSWNNTVIEPSDDEKRLEMTKAYEKIITARKESLRVGNEPLDFEAEYANSFVLIWGRVKAIKISGNMYKEGGKSRFLDLVEERLKA